MACSSSWRTFYLPPVVGSSMFGLVVACLPCLHIAGGIVFVSPAGLGLLTRFLVVWSILVVSIQHRAGGCCFVQA